ncbi:MAG: hypothetical protein LBM64_02295 [Deltaproteobacteria bacterium]|nr:hypothetical protein [Deltaproteobacteria bacterium]
MNRGKTAVARARPVCLARPLAALLALFVLSACTPAQPPRYTVFAMEGPPLAIAGGRLNDPGEASLFGHMDRTCMVGAGEIEIEYPPENLICQGRLKDGPAENGRVRGIIPCTLAGVPEGQAVFLLFTLGHHGPDQGVGVARLARGRVSVAADKPENSETILIEDLEISEESPLLLFYHPWDAEAGRRYLEARDNALRGLEKKEGRKTE